MTSVKWEINEGKARESAQLPNREPGVTASRPSYAPILPSDQKLGREAEYPCPPPTHISPKYLPRCPQHVEVGEGKRTGVPPPQVNLVHSATGGWSGAGCLTAPWPQFPHQKNGDKNYLPPVIGERV